MSAPSSAFPARAWWLLIIVATTALLFSLDRQVLSILKPTLTRELGMTNPDYSALVTAYMAPYICAYLFTGTLVDRFGARRTGTIFVATMSAGAIASGLAQNFTHLALARVVLGAAQAGVMPFNTVALMAWFPSERRALVFSLKSQIQALGPVFAPTIVAAIALFFGWRTAFFIPGSIGLTLAGIWWLVYRDPKNVANTASAPRPPYFQIIGDRRLRGLLLARFITDPFWFFIVYWLPSFLQEKLGLTLAEVGRLAWIPPLFAAVAALTVAALSDRMIAKGASASRARIHFLTLLACLAPCAFLISLSGNIGVALGLLSLVYLMSNCWLTLTSVLVTDIFPARVVATSTALISFVGGISSIALNLYAGALVDRFGYVSLFTFGAIAYPIAAFVLHRSYGHLPGYRTAMANATVTTDIAEST